MLTEFYFVNPLWLMTIIIIIAWLFITRHKALKTPNVIQPITIFYPLLMALKHTQQEIKPQNNRIMLCLVFCLISISLAQPAFKIPIKSTQNIKQNVDLILVVNTSVSMVLRDYKETHANGEQQFDRMEKTKRVLKQLASRFKGQRISLVVLGRPAAIWLPLTGDIDLALHTIDKLQTTLGGRSSDISATLQLVFKQFNSPSNHQKTVLLVNDGYLQIGSVSPEQSVRDLANNNFIVHTLAIGSPKQPEFSLGVGHLIYSPVDLKLMQTLADAGKGSMIHAWQNKPVEELLKAIDQPINKSSRSQTRFKNNTLYFYPLSLAMLIMLFMVFPMTHLSLNKQT